MSQRNVLAALLVLGNSWNAFAVDIKEAQGADVRAICRHLLTDLTPAAASLYKEKPNLELKRTALNKAMEEIHARLDHAKSQLALPNEQREQQDNRWFASWRNPEGNPVTQELRNEISRTKLLLQNWEARQRLLSELENLSRYAQRDISDSDLRLVVFHLERGVSVLESSPKTSESLNASREEVAAFVESLRALKWNEVHPDKPLLFTAALSEQNKNMDEAAKEVLARVPAAAIRSSLANLAMRLQVPFREVLEHFRTLDNQFAQHRIKGVHDNYVYILLQTSLLQNVAQEKIVDLFVTIDRLGKSTKENFSIHDAEVAVLVDIAARNGVSASELMKTFFTLEEMGRKNRSDFHLNDSSLVVLTGLHYETQIAPQTLVDSFFVAYDLGKMKEKGFYINDLGTALLVEAKVKFNASEEQVVNEFFDIRAQRKANGLGKRLDEDLARLTLFARAMQLDATALTQALAITEKKYGYSTEASLFIIANAMEQERGLEEAQLLASMGPKSLDFDNAQDSLTDQENRGQRNSNGRQRGGSSQSGSSGSSSSSSGSDPLWNMVTGDMLGTGIPGGIDMDFTTPF